MIGKDLQQRFVELIWSEDLSHVPKWKRLIVHFSRLIYAGVRDLTQGELNLRAMSLVFTSLLALVPLLALSFALLKAFGAHNRLAPFLTSLLAPFGEKAQTIVDQLLGFVSNVKVGLLGSVGFIILLYAVVALLRQVEAAFNQIWRTPPPKGFAARISEYMGALLLGPLLIFCAIGVTAAIGNSEWMAEFRSIPVIGFIVYHGSGIVPYAILCTALVFIYTFVTNTTIRIIPAFGGAAVAALLWDLIGSLFRLFVSTSNNYDVIYSGFAVGMLFVIWVYLCWFILLLGSNFAFYMQHPSYLRYARPAERFSGRQKERIGLAAMVLIANNKRQGRNGWTSESLAARLGIPAFTLSTILEELRKTQFLQELDTQPSRWALLADTCDISAHDVIAALRTRDDRQAPNNLGSELEEVEALLKGAESNMQEILKSQTLANLSKA